MEPENSQAKTVTTEAGVQLPPGRTAVARITADTPATLPPPVTPRAEAEEARRDAHEWSPEKEKLEPLVSPYKIAIEVDRGTVSFDENTRAQFLEKRNLGRGKGTAPAAQENFDEAVMALLKQPLTPEQFEKMIVDVQKFVTFQNLCSISRSWRSIKNGGQEPDNTTVMAEALDRRVGNKLYLNVLFSERTIMGVPVSINKLFQTGYLKNEDFAGKDPKGDLITQRVLKPFLDEVLVPADFMDMPREYMPWIVQELKTRTEAAARSHPAVKAAAQKYIQDQLQGAAGDWISTFTNSNK